MRLIIIGDSLILFRSDRYNSIDETYGFIIKNYFKSKNKDNEVFMIMPRGGNNTNNTKYQSDSRRMIYDIIQFEPDIVIIHLGIVDCAPRLLTEHENTIIGSLPYYIRKKIIKFLSKNRFFFTKTFQKVYVKIEDFEKNYQKILTLIKKIGAIPIIINITKPNQRLLNRSYKFLERVNNYNNVMLKLSNRNNYNLIDIYSMIENEPILRWKDGIHLSKEGHKRLAEIIIHKIEAIYE